MIYLYLAKDNRANIKKSNCNGTLSEKFEFYKSNKNRFRILFLGDSRTYTNIHNFQIDSALHINSYNLSIWANWFPTQYSFFSDFLEEVPDSTILFFSIGHQNFVTSEIQNSYPIDYSKISAYLDWCFSYYDLRKPLAFRNCQVLPILFLSADPIHDWRKKVLGKYLAVFSCPKEVVKQAVCLPRTGVPEVSIISEKDQAEKIKQYYLKDSNVFAAIPKLNGDSITSLEIFWKKGNYWRIEIDSLFFRNKQKEDSLKEGDVSGVNQSKFNPDPRYWNNFTAIIGLLKKHNKRLKIFINQMDEAPYSYHSNRKYYDDFMQNKVRKYVEANGLPFLYLDVRDMPSYYYFDYNHLNSKGSVIYTKRLIELLKQKI